MASKSPENEGVIKTRLQDLIVDLERTHKRSGLKISQYRIAKQSGMAYITVNSFFHNKSTPSLNSIYKISDAINEILSEKGINQKIHPKDFLI